MAKEQQSGSITLQATSFHDAVLPQPLRFAPPYADLAEDNEGFSRFWQFSSYVFDLPDPTGFPPFPGPFDARDLERLSRFVASCREIAGYSMMSARDSVTFRIGEDGEALVETTKSSRESLRGFIVLFRQLYANDETASYHDVVGIISKAIKATNDEDRELRDDIIRPWRRAHGLLMQQRIEAIVARKFVNSEYIGQGDSPVPIPFEHARPTELISRYMYGDLVHFGSKRDALKSIGASELEIELDYMNFLEAATGLSHFYLGFSRLLARAFRLDEPAGPMA